MRVGCRLNWCHGESALDREADGIRFHRGIRLRDNETVKRAIEGFERRIAAVVHHGGERNTHRTYRGAGSQRGDDALDRIAEGRQYDRT